MQNGSTAPEQAPPGSSPSYERWSREAVQRVFGDHEATPVGTWIWALCGVGSAVAYALLDIAKAIRERP